MTKVLGRRRTERRASTLERKVRQRTRFGWNLKRNEQLYCPRSSIVSDPARRPLHNPVHQQICQQPTSPD